VRTYAVEHMDVKAGRMNAYCRSYVNAASQAKATGSLISSKAQKASTLAESPYFRMKVSTASFSHSANCLSSSQITT